MSNEITISIQADDPATLAHMLRELARELSPAIQRVSAATTGGQVLVEAHTGVAGEAPKRGRGRPRKEDSDPENTEEPFLAGGLAGGLAGHDGADSLAPGPSGSQGVAGPNGNATQAGGTVDAAASNAPGATTPAINGDDKAEVAVQVVGDLTPTDARDQAIKLLMGHFGKNPNNMSEITKLQTTYGVKMFKDVPDDRALAFLADVKLVAAGTPASA